MPARPMWRSPHKKVNGWARGYLPEFGKRTHSHNDQGNVPPGKIKKMARWRTEPPGFPQGTHIDNAEAQRLGRKVCLCGGCYIKNDGRKVTIE